jgi:hypothetical protein
MLVKYASGEMAYTSGPVSKGASMTDMAIYSNSTGQHALVLALQLPVTDCKSVSLLALTVPTPET